MLCVSPGKTGKSEIAVLAAEVELVEVRMDLNSFSMDEIKEIFSTSSNLIAVYRPGKVSEEDREEFLRKAIIRGAKMVDIELETKIDVLKRIRATAKEAGSDLIISYHNYECTPDQKELAKIANDIFSLGADIAKIACQAETRQDILNILSLYGKYENIIATGMGMSGSVTRLAGEILGSPVTYTSLEGRGTAEGQIDHDQMRGLLDLFKRV